MPARTHTYPKTCNKITNNNSITARCWRVSHPIICNSVAAIGAPSGPVWGNKSCGDKCARQMNLGTTWDPIWAVSVGIVVAHLAPLGENALPHHALQSTAIPLAILYSNGINQSLSYPSYYYYIYIAIYLTNLLSYRTSPIPGLNLAQSPDRNIATVQPPA